jgi:hypothetical protein
MFDVETLVTMAWQGEVRVPHFQRDFRWQRRDVIRLFDSIVRGYPVGSLLLWRRPAPAQSLRLGALRIEAPASDRALWVVDGQQRITSLANALHPQGTTDDRFNLAYDLAAGQFVPPPAGEEPLVIPLPVIFDLQKILGWFARYPEVVEQVDRANAVTKTLRQFPIPAYEVVQASAEVLQDIFDRMNNYGKRLSRAEIFSALFAGDESERGTRLTLDRIAEGIDQDLGFGVIDKDTVLKAILARRGPDVLREIRNELAEDTAARAPHTGRAIIEFPDEDRDTAYRLGGEALRRAVRFLQNTAGVPHVSVLAYRHLLVALTRVFAHHPEPDDRSLRLLRRWFWRAAMVGPENFKGSTSGAIRSLCFAVKRDSLVTSIDELLTLVDRPDRPLPDLRRFRSNEAGTKIILCAWWSEGPRSLRDGEPVGRASLSDSLLDRPTALDAVRYIVPRLAVPEPYRLWAADRLLLPDADIDNTAVGERLLTRPLDVGEAAWQATLRSHLLDDRMVTTLGSGDVTQFLMDRERVLQVQLTRFLQRMCEWGFEDTPPLSALVVEDLDDGDNEPA